MEIKSSFGVEKYAGVKHDTNEMQGPVYPVRDQGPWMERHVVLVVALLDCNNLNYWWSGKKKVKNVSI